MVDAVIQRYFPSTGKADSPAIALGLTLTAFAGMRLILYLDWKRQRAPKLPEPKRPAADLSPPPPEAKAPESEPAGGIRAQISRAANA